MTTITAQILVVDDNPGNTQLLAGLLDDNGYDVAVAASGPHALAYLGGARPDLILLDVMMPEMDGYETCRKIKEMEGLEHIPVIFLTAKNETEDLVKGFRSGGVDYLTKPFITEELLVRIHTHIALKRAREEIVTLRGFIPVCSYCRKVRDDKGVWDRVETYVEEHSDASFTHGVCPECADKVKKEMGLL